MASNYFKVKKGANLEPLASSVSAKGDLAYNSATDKLELYNGAVDPLVNEAKAATLTNKSIDSDNNTITNIVNANIKASAAIAYSKLNLSNSILNTDINSAAAIAYSKLNLSNSILNADINSSAAIAYSKLALSNSIVNADINSAAAIAYSKLNLTGAILNADLAGSITASKLVGTDITTVGTITTGTWSATTIALNKGGTGQTTKAAAFDALSPMTTGGDIIYGGASGTGTRLTNGGSGQVLTSQGTTLAPIWATTSTSNNSYLLENLGLSASVAANALTIALKQADGSTDPSSGVGAVKIGFRSNTASTGNYNVRSATSATSVVVSSGSTLGTVNSISSYIWVYAIDIGGTIELAVSHVRYDEGTIVSTVAEGGLGAANNNHFIYSTAARSNAPIRLLGRLTVNETTAGTWASTPIQVSLASAIEAGETVIASYKGLNNGGAVSSGTPDVVRCTTKVMDTHNAYDTSTGIYTIPKAGVYDIRYAVGCTMSATTAVLLTKINITGTDIRQYAQNAGATVGGREYTSGTSYMAYLAVNDTVKITAVDGTAGSTYSDGINQNYFQITNIGIYA